MNHDNFRERWWWPKWKETFKLDLYPEADGVCKFISQVEEETIRRCAEEIDKCSKWPIRPSLEGVAETLRHVVSLLSPKE